jgi:DNA repair ATPase RecN
VRKEVNNTQTQTVIEALSNTERVEAIARLLSGAQVSEAARKTAQELLTSV